MMARDIRRLAEALGIQHARRKGIPELIHSIHDEEGQLPCMSESWSAPCLLKECPFADICSSIHGGDVCSPTA